jgi:hypothetical protein
MTAMSDERWKPGDPIPYIRRKVLSRPKALGSPASVAR